MFNIHLFIINIYNCTFYLLGVLVVEEGMQGDTERLCSEHIIAIDERFTEL